ncbi:MAG: hypothetical protein ACMG6E_04720 [Candidatus Roizmanbacteria bacterium]
MIGGGGASRHLHGGVRSGAMDEWENPAAEFDEGSHQPDASHYGRGMPSADDEFQKAIEESLKNGRAGGGVNSEEDNLKKAIEQSLRF